jgi:hypothetical protein
MTLLRPFSLATFLPPAQALTKGLSLMELLVSAALVGGMGLLLLPTLTNGQIQQKEWHAKLKSTMGSIENAAVEAAALGETNSYLALRNRLKVLRECPGDAFAQGCWSAVQDDTVNPVETLLDNPAEQALILKNGVTLFGLHNSNGFIYEGFRLDANGAAPPNVPGKDQIQVTACLDNNGCGQPTVGYFYDDMLNGPAGSGSFKPNKLVISTGAPQSYALYQKLYN